MFLFRRTTMRSLLVAVSVLVVLGFQCYAVEGRDLRQFSTGRDGVDGRGGGGGGGEGGGGSGQWVAPRTQWTIDEAVDEDDADASLRGYVVQAVERTRSRTQVHAIRSRSPEDLVTPTQLTFLDLAHLYLPAMANVSKECRRDLTAFYWSIAHLGTLIKNGTLWPLKLVDSWGKFSDGMLEGNLQQLGFFKECLDIRVYQPLQTFDLPLYPLSHPFEPLNHHSQQQNFPSQPQNAYPKPHNFISKTQTAQLYLSRDFHDQERHQHLPPQVYKALNLPHGILRAPPQSSPDLQEHPNLPPQARNPLQLLLHPHDSSQDAPLRRHADVLDSSTTTPTFLPSADFSGQYCLVKYAKNDEESQALLNDNLRTPVLSASLPAALSLMAYSTCMPSTCTPEELQVSVDAALQEEGLQVASLECQVEGQGHPLGAAEITGIVIVSLLVALMLLGALADLLTSAPSRLHLREGPLQYLLAFSVTTNIQKIFHLETRKLPGHIPSINGIRFISITWVVLGHQYLYSAPFTENMADLSEISKPTLVQVIINADKSVDTFLLVSGLLATLGLLGTVGRRRRFNMPFFIFHRLLRLWPPVALSTMLIACLAGLFVSGPYANQYWNTIVKGCRHRWWSDVTLLNNIVFLFLGRLIKEPGEAACCLPHTWYLSVDLQIYLAMPLMILPLIWWPRKGRLWLMVCTIGSIIIPAVIIAAHDLWPTSLLVLDAEANVQYTHKVYIAPWCRAGPYLVGACTGYIMHLSKDNPAIARLKPWQVCLGWVAAVGVALAVVLGIAPYNYLGTPSEMSTAEAAVYGGVHRAAWGLAVAWVVVACTWGYGGPVAWILEHPIWQPFSRLTYCIYLISLPLQFVILHSTKRLTYYTYYTKLQETVGVLVVTVVVSLFVSLASESPTLRLEKILLRRSPDARPNATAPEVTTPAQQETGQGREDDDVTQFAEKGKSRNGDLGDPVMVT